MADSENTRIVPDGTTTSADTPAVREDIARVLVDIVDALHAVNTGISSFLRVAADHKSDFADTSHWMVGKIGDDVDAAVALAEAALGAARVDSTKRKTDDAREAVEAAARLREFAATEPEELPHMTAQKAIDGAVADAVFVLARALRWGQFEPMVDGLRRAGVVAQGGEA